SRFRPEVWDGEAHDALSVTCAAGLPTRTNTPPLECREAAGAGERAPAPAQPRVRSGRFPGPPGNRAQPRLRLRNSASNCSAAFCPVLRGPASLKKTFPPGPSAMAPRSAKPGFDVFGPPGIPELYVPSAETRVTRMPFTFSTLRAGLGDPDSGVNCPF